MQTLKSGSRSWTQQQQQQRGVQARPLRSQCSRPRVTATPVQAQQQNATTVTTSTQEQEDLTEKEVMSRAYNEQMQKQMGWNNPYEVRDAQLGVLLC